VQPPSDCFCSGAGDGSVPVAIYTATLTGIFKGTVLEPWGMEQTDRQTDRRKDRSIAKRSLVLA